MVEIREKPIVRKVADLGKPGTVNHAVELEIRVPRRKVFRAIVPFLIAIAMLNQDDSEN